MRSRTAKNILDEAFKKWDANEPINDAEYLNELRVAGHEEPPPSSLKLSCHIFQEINGICRGMKMIPKQDYLLALFFEIEKMSEEKRIADDALSQELTRVAKLKEKEIIQYRIKQIEKEQNEYFEELRKQKEKHDAEMKILFEIAATKLNEMYEKLESSTKATTVSLGEHLIEIKHADIFKLNEYKIIDSHYFQGKIDDDIYNKQKKEVIHKHIINIINETIKGLPPEKQNISQPTKHELSNYVDKIHESMQKEMHSLGAIYNDAINNKNQIIKLEKSHQTVKAKEVVISQKRETDIENLSSLRDTLKSCPINETPKLLSIAQQTKLSLEAAKPAIPTRSIVEPANDPEMPQPITVRRR